MEGMKQAFSNCFSKRNEASTLNNKYELEKIDVVHRYEPNLRVYVHEWNDWKKSGGADVTRIDYLDFFHWLDLGPGKNVNAAACPRDQLEYQRVLYLRTPSEREEYEVLVVDGMLVRKRSGDFVNMPGDMEMIYVLSPAKKLFIGEKEKGKFHHSSFLNGGDVICAGHLKVIHGKLTALSAKSGHYKPTNVNFQCLKRFLLEKHVELKNVQMI